MMRFQVLEQAIKEHITAAYAYADSLASNKVSFRSPQVSLERMTLGGLAKLYERHSNRPDNIARVKALVEQRNTIAHKVYPKIIDSMMELDLDWDAACKELADVSSKATLTYSHIHQDIAILQSWTPRQ